MGHRRFLVILLVLCFPLLIGCRPSPTMSPEGKPEPPGGRFKVKYPLIKGATLDGLTSGLGSDFTREDGDQVSPAIFKRQVDSHEVYVAAFHDTSGNIHYVNAYTLGPKNTEDQIDKLFGETANALVTSLGLAASDDVRANVELGVIRTRTDCAHTFLVDSVYCGMTPTGSADQNSTVFPPRNGFVERNFAMTPLQGSLGPKPKAIQGASVAELKQLLDGFTAELKIGDEQTLFVRAAESHTDFVQCTMLEGDRISRIEAFVGRVVGDADLGELNNRLWALIADMSYKDADPKKLKAFITGEKLAHPSGWGVDVGYAHFHLPISKDGRYKHLVVWAHQPPERF